MSETIVYAVSWGVVKANVYAGDNCDQHEPYIEMYCEGDMESSGPMNEICFDKNRWPVGTKITFHVPCCPNPECDLDAEFQDEHGKCECGFDWKNWAEEKYS